jgi:hypothetical protein
MVDEMIPTSFRKKPQAFCDDSVHLPMQTKPNQTRPDQTKPNQDSRRRESYNEHLNKAGKYVWLNLFLY